MPQDRESENQPQDQGEVQEIREDRAVKGEPRYAERRPIRRSLRDSDIPEPFATPRPEANPAIDEILRTPDSDRDSDEES